MDYKEKYEMALETIQEILDSGSDSIKMSRLRLRLQSVFPELKESEDEKIRKSLLEYLHTLPNHYAHSGVCAPEWIAWLEKQGERKKCSDTCVSSMMDNKKSPYGEKRDFGYFEDKLTDDKVEPKFNVGDWVVVNGETLHIKKVIEGGYLIEGGGFMPFRCEKEARLWTNQDAKDGDILAFYSEYKGNKMMQVGIVKEYVGKHGGCSNTFNIYVGVNWDNNLQIGEYMGCSDIQPATKEQRDLLFQKMAEAGYEWDNELKELKKIDNQTELTKFEDAVKDMMDDYRDAIGDYPPTVEEVKKHSAYMLSLIPKNSVWSEEDEKMCQETIDWFEKKCFPYALESENPARESIKWLKSFKTRVQPKQEWSEEDEKMLADACIMLDWYQGNNWWKAQHIKNWIKALKQRIGG